MKKQLLPPSIDEIGSAVRTISVYNCSTLDRSHPNHNRYGGAAQREAWKAARKATTWLRKHELADDGKPLSDASLETQAERVFDAIAHRIGGLPERMFLESLDAYVERHRTLPQWYHRALQSTHLARNVVDKTASPGDLAEVASMVWLGWSTSEIARWKEVGCKHPGEATRWVAHGIAADVLLTISDALASSPNIGDAVEEVRHWLVACRDRIVTERRSKGGQG